MRPVQVKNGNFRSLNNDGKNGQVATNKISTDNSYPGFNKVDSITGTNSN